LSLRSVDPETAAAEGYTTLIHRRSHVHGRPGARLSRLAGWAILVAGLLAAGLAALPIGGSVARAEARSSGMLAVLPFEIDDNSGEVGAPGRHDAMLADLTRFIGARIAAAGLFEVVDEDRVAKAVAAANPGTYLRRCNGCERDIAASVGADHVAIGWLFKMSTLVMSLHVVVKEVATGNIIYAHTFDFRGDNEKAWQRAADYMVEALRKRFKPDVPPTN
jgi:Protein of unknown function (DUF2380)